MSWIKSNINDCVDITELVPDTAKLFNAFYNSFWHLSQIPATTLEVCRLRLAQLHRSELEYSREEQKLPVEKRSEISNWVKSTVFTDAERACLAFTEVYAMDPQALTDELANNVKAHYSDDGLVAFIEALGMFNGLTRIGQLWQLDEGKM
jgi:alkylhydroperoxidase family enzyme